ncbi:MAG TPA: hypothetical protein VFW98_11645, partial [Gemmatimonadaceae bacterium]|nr:hypothetical protein [Gemmatimonadaceae bacterium]
PLPVAGGHLFTTIQLSGLSGCGLDQNKVAWCWGNQQYGEIGTGTPPTPVAAMEPVQVAGGHHYSALTTESEHTCAVTTSGVAECWGNNKWGQSGSTGVGSFVTSPTAVGGSIMFTHVVAGQEHTCALTADGSAYCWGLNRYHQLGVSSGTSPCAADASAQCATEPLAVSGGLHFASLTAGRQHTCGLTADGHAYCWGRNAEGELGDGTEIDRASPTPVAGDVTFKAISGRDLVTCGLTSDGAIYCWGYNLSPYGGADVSCTIPNQPGSFTSCQPTPTQLSTTLAFQSIDMGSGQICGTADDGVLYCWGFNYHGALGDGTTQDRTAPTRVLRQP